MRQHRLSRYRREEGIDVPESAGVLGRFLRVAETSDRPGSIGRIAAAGGAHLCASILDRPPRVPLAEREAGARLLRNCLVVLKALSSHRPCVDYLMEAKVASSAISLSPLLQASPCLAVTVVSERAFPLSLFSRVFLQ